MPRQTTHPALMVGDARACVRRFGHAPRVAGRPVLPPDANEEQWLAARRPMVTASEIAAVLGKSTYDSPFSLWWRKQPDWPGAPTTPNMHIGRRLESVIGDLWREMHPEAALYRPGAALWAHPIEEWLGATPDYLSVWPTTDDPEHSDHPGEPCTGACRERKPTGVRVEPVECKSDEGGKGWGKPGTGEIPEHHLYQVLTQCIVLGVQRGHVMRLQGKRVTEYAVDVQLYDTQIAEIIREGRAFHTSLTTGMAPDIDEHNATETTLMQLYPAYVDGTYEVISDELAREWHDAKQAVRDAKALESFAGNRIREALGRAQAQDAVTADGTRHATRSHYKRRGYEVGPAEVDQLREARP